MSDFMKQMGGDSRSSTAGARRPIQTNMTVQITGHDLTAADGGVVNGIVRTPDWMIGTPVSVRMMNVQESTVGFRSKRTAVENDRFFKTRPTVEKLMGGYKVGKNQIEPMQPGGLLHFYGCTRTADIEGAADAPEAWKAQYAENFGNNSTRDAVHGFTRITMVPGNDTQRTRAYADVLFPREATLVKNIDDLRGFYDEYMQGQYNGVENNGNSLIRIIDPVNNSAKSGWIFNPREQVNLAPQTDGEAATKASIPADADATWKASVEDGNQALGLVKLLAAAMTGNMNGLDEKKTRMAQALKGDLDAGKLIVEAIPGRRIPIVGSSLEDMMDPNSKLSKAAARCQVSVEGDKIELGFVKMTVGTFTSGRSNGDNLPDQMALTKVAPDEFASARTINFLRTPHYTPPFTKAREQEAVSAAEAAADVGSVPESHIDEVVTQDPAEDNTKKAEADNNSPSM